MGVGGIDNLPGPPPFSVLGPWGVNRDWCGRPQVRSAPHQEGQLDATTRNAPLWQQRVCTEAELSPMEAGTELSPALRSAS